MRQRSWIFVGLIVGCGGGTTGGTPDAATVADGAQTIDAAGGRDLASTGDLVAGGKRVFITGQKFAASFGGLAGGDAACTSAAQGAQLGGTWKAWLSTTTVDAIDRLVEVGAWRDVQGTLIFASKASLAGSPSNALWLDEKGTFLSSDPIWTGTATDGTYVPALGPGSTPCMDWTTATMADEAMRGMVGANGANWTAYANTTCDQTAHLLCFEQ